MEIRTARLATAVVNAGAGLTTAYTVPAGHHVRLRRTTMQVQTNGAAGTVFLVRSNGDSVKLLTGTATAAAQPFNDAGDHVLEAGDVIQVLETGGTQLRCWFSGTVYTD